MVIFRIVGKARDSRRILVLVCKRLKQISKPEYLLALALFKPFQVLFGISFKIPIIICFLQSKATMAGKRSQLSNRTLRT